MIERLPKALHLATRCYFDVGGGTTEGSNEFRRTGSSRTTRQYTLPADLRSNIRSSFKNAGVSDGLQGAENNFLEGLLTRSNTSVPGLSTLGNTMNIDPLSFQGSPALTRMMDRNPYSTDYENATSALYNRMFNQARAQAISGPSNVRGGQARTGFELADLDSLQSINRFKEVRGQQDKEAGVIQNAVQLANTIEQMRRGSQLQAQQQNMMGEEARTAGTGQGTAALARLRANHLAALQLASEMLGRPQQITNDDLAGRGQQVQNTSNWNFGLTL